jgi:hypothetical protein
VAAGLGGPRALLGRVSERQGAREIGREAFVTWWSAPRRASLPAATSLSPLLEPHPGGFPDVTPTFFKSSAIRSLGPGGMGLRHPGRSPLTEDPAGRADLFSSSTMGTNNDCAVTRALDAGTKPVTTITWAADAVTKLVIAGRGFALALGRRAIVMGRSGNRHGAAGCRDGVLSPS